MQHLIDRFISYAIIDTESDPYSNTTPSTAKQFNLANLLVKELQDIGLTEVSIDERGYVMGTLESNVDHEVPTMPSRTSCFHPTISAIYCCPKDKRSSQPTE